MENLKEALSYAVELKDDQEKIVMGYEGRGSTENWLHPSSN